MLIPDKFLQPFNSAQSLARDFGAKTLAAATGCSSAAMVSNRFNPQSEHALRFFDVLAATDATDDNRILTAWARLRGFRLEPVEAEPVDRNELLGAMLDMDEVRGEFSALIREAIEDGVISLREEQELATKASELREIIDRLQLRQGTVK